MSKNVAIVGATGSVGSYITDALLKSKSRISLTAITRKGGSHNFPEGLKSAEVDYNDEESLVTALEGNEVLIISLGVTAPPDTQHRLLRAAVKAGVAYIFPNEFNYENDPLLNNAYVEDVVHLYHHKARFRQDIQHTGIKWIGIAHGFWYEFSIVSKNYTSFGISEEEKKALIIGDGDIKIKTTTWRQNDIFDSVLRVTHDSRENWDIKKVDEKEWLDENYALMSTPMAPLAHARILYARHLCKDQKELGEKYNKLRNTELGLAEEDLDEATLRGLELAKSGYSYI